MQRKNAAKRAATQVELQVDLISHRPQTTSREAAQQESPRRKPWVQAENNRAP